MEGNAIYKCEGRIKNALKILDELAEKRILIGELDPTILCGIELFTVNGNSILSSIIRYINMLTKWKREFSKIEKLSEKSESKN